MIKFTSLKFRNFLGFGNVETVIDLNTPGTTLIIGRDYDNTPDGLGSNGVGKTTIINALTYALYDKTIAPISKDNLVNNINKKHMEVWVAFEKSGNKYEIQRTRKMKPGADGNSVHLFENGKDITIGGLTETNELIEKILGISYYVFVRIVVFSASQTPFLELPFTHPSYANQTDIIEELFNLTSISAKAATLKELIKETDKKIEIQTIRINSLEREHNSFEDQLNAAKNRVYLWDKQNEKSASELQEELDLIVNINYAEQEKLFDEKDKLEQIIHRFETEINKYIFDKNAAYKEITLNEAKHSECQLKIGEHKSNRKHTEEKIISLENQITHLRNGKCPMCLQHFPDYENKIKELEKENEEQQLIKQYSNDEIAKSEDRIADLSYEKQSYINNFRVAQQREKDNRIKQNEVKKQLSNIKLLVNTRQELNDLKLQESILRTKKEEHEKLINPYVKPLADLENTQPPTIDYTELNDLNKRSEHQKFLLKLLTKKDSFVRKVLINKNIPYLNKRLQHYLTIVGLPHKVEFTHEMVCTISQFGRELDFGNLSAGQQARVNLALSFAFRDVLEALHDSVNICLMDEVLDHALDSSGLQAAARLLKRKARDEKISLFIISHRNEIGHSFDRSLIVELNKGFSSIKSDEEKKDLQ